MFLYRNVLKGTLIVFYNLINLTIIFCKINYALRMYHLCNFVLVEATVPFVKNASIYGLEGSVTRVEIVVSYATKSVTPKLMWSVPKLQ